MNKRTPRLSGNTPIDALMSFVAPVVGGAIGVIVIMRLTDWPKASCFVVGFVVGTLVSWVAILGIMVCVAGIAEAANRRKDANKNTDGNERDQ